MTLRLTDEEAQALREYAEANGRSMQEVAREAIRDYIAERRSRREQALARIVAEDSELLDLLAQ